MALSQEQIESLYAFTAKKYVHYYDLQVELVDHLAASIEEEMENDKQLTFDRARERVYDRFGIFGFSKIVQEKVNQMNRQHRRIWWNAFWQEFNWPNVLRSLSILLFLIIAFHYLHPLFLIVAFTTVSLFLGFKEAYINGKYFRGKKKLLMLELIPTYNFSSWIFLQIIYIQIFPKLLENTAHQKTSVYFLIAMIYILTISYLAYTRIAKNVIAKAKEQYPKAFVG